MPKGSTKKNILILESEIRIDQNEMELKQISKRKKLQNKVFEKMILELNKK